MANPQTENGFTRIANEILEMLSLCTLTGGQLRVIWVVIRKTYGYRKKQDYISLSQFEKYTGLTRGNVCTILKYLVSHKVLLKNNSFYKLNKNYEDWVVPHRTPLVPHKVIGSASQGTESSASQGTHKRKKENIQKKREMGLKTLKEDLIKKRII